MKKIAVMISGSGSNLEAIVKACHQKNIYGEIVYVISIIQMHTELKEQKNIIFQ